MGRPLMARSELRDAIEVYFSRAERETIERRAGEAGLSLSSFIRRAALGQRVQTVPQPNAARWQELARLAANINQIAHHANITGEMALDPSALAEVGQAVQALRRDLLGVEVSI